MLLSEVDIVYVTQKAIKAQALADHLAENPVVGEDISQAYPGRRVFFDGATNHQGKGIRAVLVSESGQHYLMVAKLRFNCTNNMTEYEAWILGLRMAIDMNVHELLVIGDSDLLIHQVQGEWAVKNLKITPYVQYIRKLCKRFRKIEFRFGVPESIIIDNGANLNSHLMRKIFGDTPYLLVYGTETVIHVEVEIPSLRIIQEAELSDDDWVRK
ncbi:uncharacterized protein LOC125873622 [Solanum stenotomum]|uniref:uncharacterized protein LOC125873622 n=1 Tax=Solanum stenotomum TaxID=172797 RepID=UPI0020D035D3|nr:uncharacterized protein LOC125873622 [Solanum stenotomum]